MDDKTYLGLPLLLWPNSVVDAATANFCRPDVVDRIPASFVQYPYTGRLLTRSKMSTCELKKSSTPPARDI